MDVVAYYIYVHDTPPCKIIKIIHVARGKIGYFFFFSFFRLSSVSSLFRFVKTVFSNIVFGREKKRTVRAGLAPSKESRRVFHTPCSYRSVGFFGTPHRFSANQQPSPRPNIAQTVRLSSIDRAAFVQKPRGSRAKIARLSRASL